MKRNGAIYFFLGCLVVVGAGFLYAKRHAVINKHQQQMMTPDDVLNDLIEGNKHFYSDASRHTKSLISLAQATSKEGQFPKAVILACMDSRSIPELVFDQSIGDIFTLRVAGNVMSNEMIASMEYATKHMGAKLIVIMGHTQCGAVKAACENKVSGYIEALVADIAPAVETIREASADKKIDCADAATTNAIAAQNVRNMVAYVTRKSSVIRELIEKGTVKIVGAMHDLESGVVTFE